MANPHCRIGKVTIKAAPHLSVVRHPALAECDALGDHLKRHAQELVDYSPRLAGYAIVTWQLDGTFNRVTRYHKNSPIGQTRVPSFVHDVLYRLTAADVVHDVLNNRTP